MKEEGYVFHAWGVLCHLQAAVASVKTLRRYDNWRPVALYTSEENIEILREEGFSDHFQQIHPLEPYHHSLVGFKHHLDLFMPFERNLFVDSDMIWCRDPEPLWRQLSGFGFTATGLDRADYCFGTSKGLGIVPLYLSIARERTLNRFELTHLPRLQTGMVYCSDRELAKKVCRTAEEYYARRGETHFHHRLEEGRVHDSCEWSLAMAMSSLRLPVFPWLQGYNSPQLDFVESFVRHDLDFLNVSCRYYPAAFLQRLQGFPVTWLARALLWILTKLPGQGDYLEVTPVALHFGFKKHKQPFWEFVQRSWKSG